MTIITTTLINVTNCKGLTVESGVKGLPVAIGDRGGLVSSPFLSPSIVHTHQFSLQHDKKNFTIQYGVVARYTRFQFSRLTVAL